MKITPSSKWSQENLIILLLEIHDWSLIFLEIKRIISTEISFVFIWLVSRYASGTNQCPARLVECDVASPDKQGIFNIYLHF